VAGDPGRLVQFEIRTPLDAETIRAHVVSALARGLDEVAVAPVCDERLTIVANGPSALAAPLTGTTPGAPTLAINNSLRLFLERGLAPDYWMASDPQACVADYLRGAPRETVYLVASKCHPDVFETLRDRRVVLWHCAEPSTLDLLVGRLIIQSSLTVTLCALNLVPVLGFRHLDFWGWDACYLDGRSHAVQQRYRRDDITIELGSEPGQRFASTTSWAAEAQEAVRLFQTTPRQAKVHGDGLIAALLQHFALA
jgi:hypothetical protein